MDPEQAIRDLYDLVVELSQGDTKGANLRKLDRISDIAEDLVGWVEGNGDGFMPKFDLTDNKH